MHSQDSSVPNGDDLYTKLSHTATTFVNSLSPKVPGGNEFNVPAILSNLSEGFRMDWGHKYLVSTKAGLQGRKTGEEFVQHLQSMAPGLETWRIDVGEVVVDVRRRRCMVRADFHMTPKGGQGTVLNDIMFVLGMDEGGEKIVEGTEFIDAAAAGEIGRLMMMAAASGKGK